jgi:hypothetical protein
VCFGYTVRTSLPLRYARRGGGREDLRVEVGDAARPDWPCVLRWEPPAQPFAARLHEGPDAYALEIEGVGWYGVDLRRARITVPPAADPVRREERLWGMPALLCFLHRGDLPLHAAAVEVDGRAVLLAGPGRAGKTTLAAAAQTAGLRVLAEDLSCVRVDGHPAVLPGPAGLRLRTDVADRLPPCSAVVEVARDRDRAHLACRAAGSGAPVPVGAVLLLRSGSGPPGLTPVDPAEAVRDLWALSFRLPHQWSTEQSFCGAVALAGAVPVLDLHRPVRLDALEATVAAVVSAVDRAA